MESRYTAEIETLISSRGLNTVSTKKQRGSQQYLYKRTDEIKFLKKATRSLKKQKVLQRSRGVEEKNRKGSKPPSSLKKQRGINKTFIKNHRSVS